MSTSSQTSFVNGNHKPVSLTSDNDRFYSTQQQLKGGGRGDMAMSVKEVSFHWTTLRTTVVSRSRWATEDGGFEDRTLAASSEATFFPSKNIGPCPINIVLIEKKALSYP
ncbi:unnamed protein product [Microthlaspi erraticum]|uniref:Uncharacterized protein n=1 Tax=Microthlaspi erraticum TaxID=1685480 RepID=A0A6D2HDE2_9BRAS|nr:unnamed protein product [Microthlaspi erraticum]CAA7036359.1 unnamed protein product [Microthlaspi erraticum]